MLELYDIYSSLPVTSVSCERGFSIMNWIKTNIKNRMKVETLHHHMIHLNGTEGTLTLKKFAIFGKRFDFF